MTMNIILLKMAFGGHLGFGYLRLHTQNGFRIPENVLYDIIYNFPWRTVSKNISF